MTVLKTTDLANRLRAMASQIAFARSDKDPTVVLIRQGAARIEALEGAADYAHVAHGSGIFPRTCLVCYAEISGSPNDQDQHKGQQE